MTNQEEIPGTQLFKIGIMITMVVAMIVICYLIFFPYDLHQNDPAYCNVYAREYLADFGLTVPYIVNFNVAGNICEPPRWEYICGFTPPVKQNEKPWCYIAVSSRRTQK
jgi:hypothetical protein